MPNLPKSKHFTLHQLAEGVFAAIHKTGGAAYSNTGIIDLGDRTLIIDTFDMPIAAEDLRTAAEKLTSKPIDSILITHPHGDHWGGNGVFDPKTTILGHTDVAVSIEEQAVEFLEEDPAEWDEYLEELKTRLESEEDPRWQQSLQTSIQRMMYTLEALPTFQPRGIDQTFEEQVDFKGSSLWGTYIYQGSPHSSSDSIFFLPDQGIAFIGDIGFFAQQPFMGACTLPAWREKLSELLDMDYQTFVPGHGSLGTKDDLRLMLDYFDALEKAVKAILEDGGGVLEALQAGLPAPFDQWLYGSMSRFETNINKMVEYLV
jgi:glyoxylase-like metal-dependent hydrolase (beta-lactamase superfamily II)